MYFYIFLFYFKTNRYIYNGMNIYKITNKINGKIYIGKNITNDISYMGSGVILESAKKKYGVNNFVKEIIETCTSEEELNEREKYWIKQLQSTNRNIGYNIAEGGNGGNTRKGYNDNELLEYYNNISNGLKISEQYKDSVKNKVGIKRPKHSEIMRQKYNDGVLFVGKNTPKITEDTKKKISEKNKGKKRSDEVKIKIAKSKFKKVYKFDVNMVIIDEYDSIDDASKKCNINRCCISDVCNGRQKTAGGYKWSFNKI
jgi:group I intron endonuclease